MTFLAPKAWLPSLSLLTPRMPTLSSLARSAALNEERAKPSAAGSGGLFDVLLGDPKLLYRELLEDPSRFEPGVLDLVLSLVSGQQDQAALNPTEKELLNRATLDWARPRHRPSGGTSVVVSPPGAAVEHLTQPDADELEYRADGSIGPLDTSPEVIPDEVPTTLWWQT
jgi:hypothetical protein